MSDDTDTDPTRYRPGLHYTATYDLTYHAAGGPNNTITGIPIDFVYAPDYRPVPEPGACALFGSAAAPAGDRVESGPDHACSTIILPTSS